LKFPALGVILAGVRVATVLLIATIAAAIGAGGLGVFIFRGRYCGRITVINSNRHNSAAVVLA